MTLKVFSFLFFLMFFCMFFFWVFFFFFLVAGALPSPTAIFVLSSLSGGILVELWPRCKAANPFTAPFKLLFEEGLNCNPSRVKFEILLSYPGRGRVERGGRGRGLLPESPAVPPAMWFCTKSEAVIGSPLLHPHICFTLSTASGGLCV